MIDAHGISSDLSREAFTDALRRYVGHGKRWSVHALAEEAGLDARTVAAYRGGETAPSLANMLRLFAVLPPAFADEVLALSGLGGVKRLQGERADSLELNTNVTGLAAMIARHLSDDRRIDHTEEAEQEPAVRKLVEVCNGWLDRRQAAP